MVNSKDEGVTVEKLQFFRTRAGGTQEQYRGMQRNSVSSAHNLLVLGSNPSGPTNFNWSGPDT